MSVSRRELIAAVAAAAVGSAAGAEATVPPPPQSGEAEGRIAAVLDRYPGRFSAEQQADIRRLIRGVQPGLEAMRAYPLDNAVEPATVFRVYRRPTRRPARVRSDKS